MEGDPLEVQDQGDIDLEKNRFQTNDQPPLKQCGQLRRERSLKETNDVQNLASSSAAFRRDDSSERSSDFSFLANEMTMSASQVGKEFQHIQHIGRTE